MTKAKRLLAIFMAALMIVSAAFLPAYAKMLPGNAYTVPKVATNQKFYFTADQGAGWALDAIDELLAEENITLDLLDLTGLGEGLFKFAGVNLEAIDWTINLTSIDNLIYSLDVALEELDGAWLGSLASGLGLLGDLLKDKGLNGAYKTLDSTMKRGNRADNYSGGTNDLDIFIMLVKWLEAELKDAAVNIVAGTFDFGLLESALPELILDLPGFLKLTLYQLLVDENATAVPTNSATPIDDAVQQLIDWALITGTNSEVGGMNSLLGPDAEPLMPALADLKDQGGANIKGVAIKVDRNKDGVLEDRTMSFYQLVNNVLTALLDGMLAPMLGDLIIDLVGVEVNDQFPMGDPAIFEDMMFNTILGAVESLAVQNGAPQPNYTEEDNATPVGKINALMDWFFTGGGMDTFIKIDFYGIALTDNFMSLLGDLARLAINLLPGLVGGDIFEGAEALAYTADELNMVRYYKENSSGYYVTCDELEEGAIDQTYKTYEAGEILYATDWDEKTGAPTAYNYITNSKPVNTSNPDASDYRNISLIRPNYVITTDMVYACLIKMLLNGLIDGCYWPEWTTDIPSVLAYAMAALAAPAVPEGNYFARLDAYHYTGGIAPVADANNEIVEPIPYYTVKNGIEVPTAALTIGGSVAAYYLNAVFTFEDSERLMEDGTTFERFVAEFLIWAADEYLPMLIGEYDLAAKKFVGDEYYTPIWADIMNNLIGAIYSDYATRTLKETPNWDAIYTFIDNTLLKLIPTSWLPGINSSFELFNGWLLNNLLNFDLQGILSLLSTNPDENGELHQPVLTVLLRVVDRVLGLVFNGTPLLLPVTAERTGANANGVANVFINNTSITSLDALLGGKGDTNGSLPTLVSQLLTGLAKLVKPLALMILPLVMGGAYNKPYDKEFSADGQGMVDNNWLGTDMTAFKVEHLELYLSWFQDDVNAVKGSVVYTTYEDAEAAITNESMQYIKEVSRDPKEYDAENNELFNYIIYTKNDFYISADEAADQDIVEGQPDGSNSYSSFTNFRFSKLTNRRTDRPYVVYEDNNEYLDLYRFYAVEDWKTTPYAYHNMKQAMKKAGTYADEYHSFANNSLGDAYNEWQRYFIQTRLYSDDLLDTNGDGRCVISTTDTDYVAATDNDPGFPVDDMPEPPTVMLPYYTTDATTYHSYKYLDQTIDNYAYLYPVDYHRGQFEQLDMALKLGEDVTKNIVLDDHQAEEVVRLAIGNRSFDITMDGNGHYEEGSIQWAGLSSTQLQSITSICSGMKYVFTYDLEAGTYEISRPVFRVIDGSYTVGCGVDSNPPMALSMKKKDEKSFGEVVDDQMYKSYVEYMQTMYHNRKTLYNHIDYISDCAEKLAELRTNNRIDTTILKWALSHAEIKEAYKNSDSKIRNYKVTGIKDDGTYYYTKVYTQSSYDEFRKAYDYAYSLNEASVSTTASAGLTQSMVTLAFHRLLETFGKLIDYTGDADWTQLLMNLEIAETILNDPNRNDSVLGYSSDSLANLNNVYEEVYPVSQDNTIDCERQQEVDAANGKILAAINALVYLSNPMVIPSADGVKSEIITEIGEGSNRTIGHIFGLKEGEGITIDLVDVIGLRVDVSVGNNITVEDSGKGNGTGAFYKGTIGNLEKFRFYAVLYGDINGDTRIDGTDRTAIDLYVIQGTNNSADPSAGGMGEIKFEAADINHDGKVDDIDSGLIELHYNYQDAEGNNYQIPQDEHSVVLAA
ncbi:MAG: hypothetical protein IKB88_00530 [Clostridia bacterium]|nr:hypothetical protein [Clostridia bacterium]